MVPSDGENVVATERLSPDRAFEVLASETRLRTLRVLDEAEGPLTHTALRDRVGVDDPGQFNYHLRKLDGMFVHKKGSEYELSAAGRRVIGAIISGGYHAFLQTDSIPVNADCSHCGGMLEVRFRFDGPHTECRDCGTKVNSVEIPPGAFEGYASEDIPDLLDRWIKRIVTASEYQFCPTCDGRLKGSVRETTDSNVPHWASTIGAEVVLRYRCSRCGRESYALVGIAAITHPAVAGFHYENGVDVRKVPTSELEWFEPGVATVENNDPLRINLSIDLDGDILELTFDRDMELVAQRRF